MEVKVDLPKSVDTALNNVTDSPTKEIGKTLGDLFFLVFGGISQAAEKKRMRYAFKLEQYKLELEAKVKKIPKEDQVMPDMQIVAPALEASKYCVDNDDIRKMFVNLIAASMDLRSSFLVHPSFPVILKQMTPLDAQNLSLFMDVHNLPIAKYQHAFRRGDKADMITNVFLSNPDVQDIEKQAVSISALERLGVVSVDYSIYLTEPNVYDRFFKTDYYYRLKESFVENDEDFKPGVQRGIISITPLGESLIEICLQDDE